MSSIPPPVSSPSRTYHGDSRTYPPTSPPTERESVISLVRPSNARHVRLPSINLVNALPNDMQHAQPSTSYPSPPIHGERLKRSQPGTKSIEQSWAADSQGRATMSRAPSPAPALSASSRMDDQPNGQSGSSKPNYGPFRRFWGVILNWARAWPSRRRHKRVVQNQYAHIKASTVPGYSDLPPRSPSNTPPLAQSKRHVPVPLMSPNQSHGDLEPPIITLEPRSGGVTLALIAESQQAGSRGQLVPSVNHPTAHVATLEQKNNERALGKRRGGGEYPHHGTLSGALISPQGPGPIGRISINENEPELKNVSVAIANNESQQPVGSGSNARESASQSTSLGGMGAGLSIPVDIPNTKDQNERSLQQNNDAVFDLRLLMRDHRPQNLTDTVEVDEEAYKRPKSGGNSLVYTGKWGDKLVAVKIPGYRQIRTHNSEWKVDTKRRFWREVKFAAAVSHPNINVFHGYANDEKFHMFGDFPAMISMWCRNGTILDYLNDEKPPVHQRIQLAHGVSKGVQHLHHLGLIHGDIKPTNVLVDDEHVARICDLGSMRPIPGYGLDDMITAIPYLATERYMARELFVSSDNPHPIPTPEGDVYSLGCVIVEIVEHPVYAFGHVPTPGLRTAILKGELPASRYETNCGLPEELTDSLWDLLEACWGAAAKRPRIKEVLRILTLVESLCGLNTSQVSFS